MSRGALVERIDALLPQTQCARCGFDGCRPYAEALADDAVGPDRCVPGGQPTVAELARVLERPVTALDLGGGAPARWRRARIDEAECIGCALCLPACPVDAIVGARKLMHTVLAAACTGCELCVPVCPVDCIHLDEPCTVSAAADLTSEDEGFLDAWRRQQAPLARARHARRQGRLAAGDGPAGHHVAPAAGAAGPDPDGRRAAIAAAVARTRARRAARRADAGGARS